MRLHGRDAELALIDDLLARARAGDSGALVLRGEPGIGKSALLAVAAGRAGDFRVIRAAGAEEEAELPYAGLQLLLRPALDGVGALPGVQADALRGALGLAPSGTPDRFLVGLAVLSLLAEAAAAGPLLCLVDDAQWLDPASADALAFAARRLAAESVVMLFAARPGGFPAAGLPAREVPGLAAAAASALLDQDPRARALPPARRYRVLAEAGGNPLALLELPRVAGDGAGPGPLPLTDRLRDAFQGQLAGLPAATRVILLVAAAEGTGELAPVLRAAGSLGAGLADLDPAVTAGLIGLHDGTLTFRHTLIRAAVQHAARPGQRRAAHQALADALDGPGQADRRAWQRALAAPGPDEDVARALERTAGGARARSGEAGALAWYARSAALSTDLAARTRRLSLAGAAAAAAGDLDRAAALAAEGLRLAFPADGGLSAAGTVTEGPVAGGPVADGPVTARLLETEATVAFLRGQPGTAQRRLLRASALAGDREAVPLLIEAVHAGWYAGQEELAESVACLERRDLSAAPLARLLLAAVAPVLGRPDSAADPAEAFARARAAAAGNVSEQVLVCGVGLILGHDAATREVGAELSQQLRAGGQIGWLPSVLFYAASAQAYGGRPGEARATVDEALTLARDTGQQRWTDALAEPLALVAAVSGDERRCHEVTDAALAGADRPAWSVPWTSAALGLLDLGYGRPEAALARLQALAEGRRFFHIPATRSTPDLVEAAVRAGRPEAAAEALTLFETWARTSGQPWTRAVAHRCRALTDGGEHHFQAALELHGRGHRPFDEARTRLLYGEWLRRDKRKADARVQLGAALETFRRIGAVPWADRASGELTATGTAVRPAEPGPAGQLTPQELQIARLAARGLSNKEIAAQLFLSPRTVGHHLYKAYPKLGVLSRAELPALDLG